MSGAGNCPIADSWQLSEIVAATMPFETTVASAGAVAITAATAEATTTGRKQQPMTSFTSESKFPFFWFSQELPRILPFRSFCAVFRDFSSRRTLGSNEIPDLALVVSVPTVCFKNERYTSTHSLCSSLQRCKKRRREEKKKEKKSALVSPTALLLRHRLD